MIKLLAKFGCIAFLFVSGAAYAGDVYVHGYTRSDGTYVQPYYRTAPDSNPYNNYSTQGNVNPYTGQPGTKSPYSSESGSGSQSPYGSQYGNPYGNPYDNGQ